jgi:K+-transporting ATPase KdpF subunit
LTASVELAPNLLCHSGKQNGEMRHDGFNELGVFSADLWSGNWVHVDLRKNEVMTMTLIDAGLLGVSSLILAYLMYALINPEKF